MTQGLDAGIGSITDLKMYLQSHAHRGYTYNDALHKWVACAMYWPAAMRTDPQYTWYRVASCANAGKSVDSCAAQEPKQFVQPLYECMQRNESTALVAAMHAVGDAYHDYPTVLINGQADPNIPEPDTHGDRVTPTIKEVCKKYSYQLPPGGTLPSACSTM